MFPATLTSDVSTDSLKLERPNHRQGQRYHRAVTTEATCSSSSSSPDETDHPHVEQLRHQTPGDRPRLLRPPPVEIIRQASTFNSRADADINLPEREAPLQSCRLRRP
jgi:hypothetical protein